MKKLISILLIFTLVASTLALFSCDLSFLNLDKEEPESLVYDGSEVTIEIWHTLFTSSMVTILDRAASKFQEIYPNITVKCTFFANEEQIYTNATSDNSTHGMPNLVFCTPEQILEYNENGKLIALDSFINCKDLVAYSGERVGFTQEQLDDFVEAFYNEGKSYGDGKMYSLPLPKETELLYYNKTVFDELGLVAPITWNDVEECIKVLKEKYPDSTPLGYDSEENLFITLAEQYNSNYTSANNDKYLFVNDTNKDFVSKFAEWYQKGWLTTSYLTYGQCEPFANSQMFMSIASSNSVLYHYPSKIDGNFEFELGVAQIPQVDPNNPKSLAQGANVAILQNENAQEICASWLFLKFIMTDVEFQALYGTQFNSLPMINSAKESQRYKDLLQSSIDNGSLTHLANEIVFEQQNSCFISPVFNGSNKARESVGLLVESIFSKYQLGENNSQMIDEEFRKALDECKK